jgi:hypothetical protein
MQGKRNAAGPTAAILERGPMFRPKDMTHCLEGRFTQGVNLLFPW